ncbi:MAG: hypothetical protein KIS76_02920 [Pyrinomonadaceae bacterium]|nr:hypothetical protein [Pyrinomonadaceae bacterium]
MTVKLFLTAAVIVLFGLLTAKVYPQSAPDAPIGSIKLSKNVLKISCLPDNRPLVKGSCDEHLSVEVEVVTREKADEIAEYEYEIDSGQIVSTGKKVTWNLLTENPGNYRISVKFKDRRGRIIGKSDPQTLILEYCECQHHCFCTKFKIASPDLDSGEAKVKRGESIVFIAEIMEDGTPTEDVDPTFSWAVEGGEIIYEGDKNSLIRVKVDSDPSLKQLKVTVKISEEWSCFGTCNEKVSRIIRIID